MCVKMIMKIILILLIENIINVKILIMIILMWNSNIIINSNNININ